MKSNAAKMFVIILVAISLATGCSSNLVIEPLPLPPKPIYQKIEASELACLDDDAYTALVRRAVAADGYIKVLRRIIEGHNEALN